MRTLKTYATSSRIRRTISTIEGAVDAGCVICVLFAILMILMLGLGIGCTSSSVHGGQAVRESSGTEVRIEKPGSIVTVRDDGSKVATTQPTASSIGGSLPSIDSANEGEIGGVKFTAVKDAFKGQAFAAVVLLIAIGGLVLMKRYLMAGLCAACFFLVLLSPVIMEVAAVAALLYVIYINRDTIRQIVHGNQNALVVMPAGEQKEVKQAMEAKHDAPTKAVISALKR